MLSFDKRYLVTMTYAGRIRIPKEIQKIFKIRKGEIVIIQEMIPGYLKMILKKHANYRLKKELKLIYLDFYKKHFEIDWGFTFVEENFRVFIPKRFRVFAGIDICRENSKKKVMLGLVNRKEYIGYKAEKFIEIWSEEVVKKYYSDRLSDDYIPI